jgi:hypothetical protein
MYEKYSFYGRPSFQKTNTVKINFKGTFDQQSRKGLFTFTDFLLSTNGGLMLLNCKEQQ